MFWERYPWFRSDETYLAFSMFTGLLDFRVDPGETITFVLTVVGVMGRTDEAKVSAYWIRMMRKYNHLLALEKPEDMMASFG